MAYGSECGPPFKPRPNSEESAITVGLIYLVLEIFYPEIKAADIEIGSKLIKAFYDNHGNCTPSDFDHFK